MNPTTKLVQRMAEVEKLLARRKTPLQIERELSLAWKCDPSEVREVIRGLREYHAKQPVASREERRDRIRASYEAILEMALGDDTLDLKLARSVLRDLTELDALQEQPGVPSLPPVQIAIQSGDNPYPTKMLDLRDSIRKLEARKKDADEGIEDDEADFG